MSEEIVQVVVEPYPRFDPVWIFEGVSTNLISTIRRKSYSETLHASECGVRCTGPVYTRSGTRVGGTHPALPHTHVFHDPPRARHNAYVVPSGAFLSVEGMVRQGKQRLQPCEARLSERSTQPR